MAGLCPPDQGKGAPEVRIPMTKPPTRKRFRRTRFLAVACLIAVANLTVVSASTLPAGFVETNVVHLTGTVAIEFDPDGILWIAQTGPGEGMHVWIYHEEILERIHSFPDTPFGERGLHNLTLDPDYADNGQVWIYRTIFGDNPRNRLSRFTNPAAIDPAKHGGIALEDEVVIWEGPTLLNVIHNGGCFVFGSDKTIYLGAGDDNQGSATSQDPFDARGKILHLNRDGSPATGNPFVDGVAGDPLVWALGFRNPFRCSIQPETDNLFIADVGGSNYEEISIGVAGGNFGWAFVEGPLPPGLPGFVYPIHSYPHDNPFGSAVIAGAHATAADFDGLYEGDFFFGDWGRGEISRMVLDGDVLPVSTEVFLSDGGRPADLMFGPDGALYYAARGVNFVRRIEYVGGANRQPTAIATAAPDSGIAPLAVTLDGAASSDPDDDPLLYAWDLGDGNAASGPVIGHTYEPGVYEATLTVDDGKGLTAISPPVRIVSGNRRPEATLASPSQGLAFDAGDVVNYSATASDPEEGLLGCEGFTWQVLFHHDNHAHPFLGPLQGICSGSFVVPVRGETSANVWYEVRVRTEDTGQPLGPDAWLDDSQVAGIFPNTSAFTLESMPVPGLTMTLDTIPFVSPRTVEGVVGLIRTIGAPETQLLDGRTWRWLEWSDAGARDHEISTPSTDMTFAATFGCDVQSPVEQVTVTKGAPGTGEISLHWTPVADPCLADAIPSYRVYVAADPRPGSETGEFPYDPPYVLVGNVSQSEFTYVPDENHRYFLVVPMGSDRLPGPLGHYDR